MGSDNVLSAQLVAQPEDMFQSIETLSTLGAPTTVLNLSKIHGSMDSRAGGSQQPRKKVPYVRGVRSPEKPVGRLFNSKDKRRGSTISNNVSTGQASS